MRIQGVFHIVSLVIFVFSLFFLVPHVASLMEGQGEYVFMGSCLLGLILAGFLRLIGRTQKTYTLRDGFLSVSLIWILAILLGAIPFKMGHVVPTWYDAIFEATSGLTTTGGTIIDDVDDLSQTYILWRSLLHWLGGLGIVVLLVAFVKSLGAQSSYFFYAESSVQDAGGLIPRVRQIAQHLWYVYIGITLACIGSLYLAGVSLFDSLNYSLSLMGAGGLSPTSAGVMAYDHAPLVEWVLIIFMILAGGNFALYVSGIRRRKLSLLWKNSELRFYGLLLTLGSLLVIICLALTDTSMGPLELVSAGAFMYVSMQTGTGFAVVDYTDWFVGAQGVLYVATFLGGCTGSMTGGIKMFRILILWRQLVRSLREGAHPDAISPVRLNNQAVNQTTLDRAAQFFFLYILTYILSVLVLTSLDLSVENSLGIVAGMLGNVGLAFGDFGPTGSFSGLSDGAKLVCIVDMILGRLEIFAILVLFLPSFWKGYLHK